MIGRTDGKSKQRVLNRLSICRNVDADRGQFNEPQIEMVPAVMGELGFERPKRGRGNGMPLIVVRGV